MKFMQRKGEIILPSEVGKIIGTLYSFYAILFLYCDEDMAFYRQCHGEGIGSMQGKKGSVRRVFSAPFLGTYLGIPEISSKPD